MVPASPASSHSSNAGAVSAGPSAAIPARSKPSAYAWAFASLESSEAERTDVATSTVIAHRPARIALDIVGWRCDVLVPVRGVHAPAHVLRRGKRKKRKLPPPVASPKPPADANESGRGRGPAGAAQRQRHHESGPSHDSKVREVRPMLQHAPKADAASTEMLPGRGS